MTLTYEDANAWRRSLVELLQERDRLAQENAILKQQIQQLQSAGAQLTPELARSWLPRFEQCSAWNELSVGNGGWDPALDAPSGGGLKDLLVDLLAVPTDQLDRRRWDEEESKRVADAIAKGYRDVIPVRPAPTRKQQILALDYILDQQHPGLGASLKALTKGLNGRLPLVIRAAFLLHKQEAVAKLTNKPEAVLKHILKECKRAGAPAQRQREEMFARMFEQLLDRQLQQLGHQPQARQVLGVAPDATADEIKQAYRQLARQHHPDAGGDPEQFHRIQQAYELLTQPTATAA